MPTLPSIDEARQLLGAAARDQQALQILARDRSSPVEVALFLAQQSIEKCLKAALSVRGAVLRRTHDLLLLETLAQEHGLVLPVAHDLLARLGPYAVQSRYLAAVVPTVTLAEALGASQVCLAWASGLLPVSD